MVWFLPLQSLQRLLHLSCYARFWPPPFLPSPQTISSTWRAAFKTAASSLAMRCSPCSPPGCHSLYKQEQHCSWNTEVKGMASKSPPTATAGETSFKTSYFLIDKDAGMSLRILHHQSLPGSWFPRHVKCHLSVETRRGPFGRWMAPNWRLHRWP